LVRVVEKETTTCFVLVLVHLVKQLIGYKVQIIVLTFQTHTLVYVLWLP
jgi:hypothetical protein